jgi:hypothetical protein
MRKMCVLDVESSRQHRDLATRVMFHMRENSLDGH